MIVEMNQMPYVLILYISWIVYQLYLLQLVNNKENSSCIRQGKEWLSNAVAYITLVFQNNHEKYK